MLTKKSTNNSINSLFYLIKISRLLIVECQAVGYDYDLETNTCLKLLESTIGVTWKEARIICQQDGGDLISILTKEKWEFVVNYIRCML